MCIAAAIAGAGVLGAVGSVVAGGEQAAGQEQAANTQAGMFKTIVGQEQPFLQGGYNAENALNQLLGASPATGESDTAEGTGLPEGYLTKTFNPTLSQLVNYPGFQFSLDQGNAATQNANAPGLGALSGAAQEGLSQFNQGLAQSYYGNYFNQFQTQQNNIFNRLSSIAALGQNAAGNLGSAGSQLGTGIAQAQAAAAGSQAAGIVGATNAISGSALPLSYLMAGQNASTAGLGAAASAYGDAADAYAGQLPVASIV